MNHPMLKSAVIYGSVLGTLLNINMVFTVHLCYTNSNFIDKDLLGGVALLLIFSFTFLSILHYRNKMRAGFISFVEAFKTGAIAALVGATWYVAIWLFFYYFFVPDFMDVYTAEVLKEIPAADLEEKIKEMAVFRERYKNPLFIILVTYAEVLPFGLVSALVGGFILKREKK